MIKNRAGGRSILTSSGHVYHLLGEPACDHVAPQLQAALFVTCGLDGHDVTDELLALLPKPTLQ